MSQALSTVTQAILLLTAPLLTGKATKGVEPLTLGEYKRLAVLLHEHNGNPGDFLGEAKDSFIKVCAAVASTDRLNALLDRGFALSQALESWQSRSISVLSRADPSYPRSIKNCLKVDTPPVLYACGDISLADSGGLAIVGSRDVSDELQAYASIISGLAADSGTTIVSGGARGIDRAGMGGALERGGRVVGVLVDHLHNAVVERENRDAIMDGNLLLISPYDPSMGFTVGNAMARNKLVYACSSAGLVVSTDYKKGGTWAGAVEQLEKFKRIPVYTRHQGERGPGIEALEKLGALPWPAPTTANDFMELACTWKEPDTHTPLKAATTKYSVNLELFRTEIHEVEPAFADPIEPTMFTHTAADREIFEDDAHELTAQLFRFLVKPKGLDEIAVEFKMKKVEMKEILNRMVQEGMLEKNSRPLRYCVKTRELFDDAGF